MENKVRDGGMKPEEGEDHAHHSSVSNRLYANCRHDAFFHCPGVNRDADQKVCRGKARVMAQSRNE